MHMRTRASVLGLAAAGMLAGTAMAQMAAEGALSGTLVGDRGGAHMAWDVTLPANADVTIKLAHWPCNTGQSISFAVWGAASKLASSHQHDACTQSAMFNTGAGGMAKLQMSNYLHGVGTWYTLTAEGMTLPEAMPAPSAAPAAASTTTEDEPAPAPPPAAAAPKAADMMTDTSASAPAMAAGAMAPAASINAQDQTLLGNSGGASASYDLMVKEGQSYTVKLHYGTDMGGTWPGIGFKVWGPNGWVASSHATGSGSAEAMFTASGDVKYTIQVYNYHHGVTAFYGIEAMAAAE